MNTEQMKKEFISPSVAYRGKPFWSWNGELRADELVRQTGVMKEMGLGGYFMHSRAGLITEYLGDEWFDLINEVADAAERDGMEAWLYDEDRWPSGSAGGKVTVDPQYRMKSLYVFEKPIDSYDADEDTYALYVAWIDGINMWAYREIALDSDDVAKAITDAVNDMSGDVDGHDGEWKILRFAIVPDPCDSNYNGTTYIDTMSRKATDKFIEMTHEEYKRRCGDRLGRSIKGIFTDEPHRGLCMSNRSERDGVISCGMCWTDDLFEEFQKRYGYDARAIIPELYYRYKGEQVAPIKLHYIDLANNLFLERFAMPINEWCENNGIIFTGHVLHEDSLMNQTVPNGSLMRFYEHMGYPGIDCLTEHNRSYWIVKQLSSATRQLGKKWLLSELYGCTGWQFDFKAHKAVGDWQALFGINLRCQHLSWYTMEGESKRDYPASILHQSPWYHDYSKVEDYFARFGLVMSEGDPACDVLVLNPIESLWCQAYSGWSRWIVNASPDVAPYEQRYAQLFHILANNQIDFDYGEEEMMSRMSSVERDGDNVYLRVGKQRYKTVLVGNMLTVRPSTLDLLDEFMAAGGSVIFAGDLPEYVDARRSQRPALMAEKGICVPYEEEPIVSAIRGASAEFVSVIKRNGDTEKEVFVQVRRNVGESGAYAAVLLNTDRANAKKDLTLAIKIPEGYSAEEWDLETGERYLADKYQQYSNGNLLLPVSLEAAGTRCFVFVPERDDNLPEKAEYRTVSATVIEDKFDYSMNEKNVCVLDWARWRWQGGVFSDVTEVLRVDRAVRSSLGLEHRGGSMLQPWFAKLHDTNKYGDLEIEYSFDISELPAGEVWLAGERPELNHYEINGVSLVNEDRNDFWVDDCFKKMRIPEGALHVGTNTVTIRVTFMRTTNIEALYLIGNFGVKIDGKKRTLTGLPKVVGCRNFEKYDLPFYTGAMTYHLTPAQYDGKLSLELEEGDRIVLSPIQATGGCIKVTTSKGTEILGWDPYEADVTDAVKRGETIDVTVVGTRRNVFGPLHELPRIVGGYGPGNFVTSGANWTDDYSLIDSGLRGIALKVQKKYN